MEAIGWKGSRCYRRATSNTATPPRPPRRRRALVQLLQPPLHLPASLASLASISGSALPDAQRESA